MTGSESQEAPDQLGYTYTSPISRSCPFILLPNITVEAAVAVGVHGRALEMDTALRAGP